MIYTPSPHNLKSTMSAPTTPTRPSPPSCPGAPKRPNSLRCWEQSKRNMLGAFRMLTFEEALEHPDLNRIEADFDDTYQEIFQVAPPHTLFLDTLELAIN